NESIRHGCTDGDLARQPGVHRAGGADPTRPTTPHDQEQATTSWRCLGAGCWGIIDVRAKGGRAMPATTDRITKTPGVCGGDACIRGHRIPVWVLVGYRRLGLPDA